MRAVVIGTSGQLALELRRQVCPSGIELIAPVKLDLTNTEQLVRELDQLRPALIINAGAYTAVDKAETERERAFAVNAAGPATLAGWSQRNGAALIHVSTDYVFDGAKTIAYNESDDTAPLGAYGESKLAGENAVRSAIEQYVIVRTSWVFSAHGSNFVKTMLRLASERDELRVVADQYGRPTAASDLAVALWQVAARIQSGTPRFGTFHFAGSGETTWHAFAQAIVDEQARYTGKRPRVTPIATHEYPTPARRPQNSILSTNAFEQAFKLTPRPWQQALSEVVGELLAKR